MKNIKKLPAEAWIAIAGYAVELVKFLVTAFKKKPKDIDNGKSSSK